MNALKFFFVLVLTFILVVGVMNQSISSYIEQRYHFAFYPQSDILRQANSFKIELEQIKQTLSSKSFSQNDESGLSESIHVDEEATVKPALESPSTDRNLSHTSEALNLSQTVNEGLDNLAKDGNFGFIEGAKAEVKQGEEFLLIGDSLMQGVAIALSKDLKNLDIKAMDLSRQSTGLSHKSYFNWANAINSALNNNPHIKYLVVLLGVNDPWDIRKDGTYYHFNTPTWVEVYTERVEEVIEVAKKHKVKLFWFEVPPVKKGDLDEKVQVLNQIYSAQMSKNGGIFVNTRSFFSVNDTFSSYIKDENNKSVKVRTDDGVHFTPRGAKEMSKLLLEHVVKIRE